MSIKLGTRQGSLFLLLLVHIALEQGFSTLGLFTFLYLAILCCGGRCSVHYSMFNSSLGLYQMTVVPFPSSQNNQKSLSVQFSSVQSLSRIRLFATPWITARQASLSITNSGSSLKLKSIESVMPSSHLILCRPLFQMSPGGEGGCKITLLRITAVKISGRVAREKRINVTFQWGESNLSLFISYTYVHLD